jgi:peptidoglycan/LPS O-acetylase OafA/YrhL
MTLTFLVGWLWPLQVQSYTLSQYLLNLTMLQEILGVPHIDGVYWSLTVELVFYVAMAALSYLAAWAVCECCACSGS